MGPSPGFSDSASLHLRQTTVFIYPAHSEYYYALLQMAAALDSKGDIP